MAKWPFQNKYFLFLDLVVLSRKRKKLQDFHFFYLLAISMKRKKVFFGSSSDVCVFVFSLAISEEREGRSQAAPKGPRLLVLYIASPQTIHVGSNQSVGYRTQLGETYGQNTKCKVFFKVSWGKFFLQNIASIVQLPSGCIDRVIFCQHIFTM